MRIQKPLETSRYLSTAILTISMMLAAQASAGQEVRFPADSGVIDVTKPPYHARGDGRTDDTNAIQRALDDHPEGGAILYFPSGNYLVSDTLRWPLGSRGEHLEDQSSLQGQGRESVILRLKDACPGFDDPRQPRAVVRTGTKPTRWTRNAIRNLTIDTGKKNRGAVGVQLIADNQGCLRDVTIRSGDGRAVTGLDLTFDEKNGPCLVKNLRVIGFDFGIRTAHAVEGTTFEHIRLEQQNRFGFANEGQCVTIRDLSSRNAVPALLNSGPDGLVTLIDATLNGLRGANARPAISNEGALFARNVVEVGYQETIQGMDARRPSEARAVEEFVSHPIRRLFASPPKSLELPVKETPEVPWDGLEDWASPTHFKAKPDDDKDDAEAIQAAIDSGKSTVYFPRGSYKVDKPVLIRKNVRRLIGCGTRVEVSDLRGRAAFKVVDGTSPVVLIERFLFAGSRTTTLQNASGRTLVVRDCGNVSGTMTGPGDVFLEDVRSGFETGWRFGRQNVWAREFAVVSEGTNVVNEGGKLWILGLKARRGGTLVETLGGGKTEVLGGLCTSGNGPAATPMFVIRDSSSSITIGESDVDDNPDDVLVNETREGTTKALKKADVPNRAGGRSIPLFVGHPGDGPDDD